MKICSICRKAKPLSDFNKKVSCKDGLQPLCRSCQSAKSKEHYGKNRPSYISRNFKNRIKRLELSAGRPKPEVCEVCGDSGKICFDHNHTTGAFRGWLCHNCNTALGHAKDNPELLQRLAKYLINNGSVV